MMGIDEFFLEQSRKNSEGVLTVGEAVSGYFRLRSGEHAGRVIIKTHAKIGDKPIAFFANGLTWIYIDKIKDICCERVSPTFNKGSHSIDYSKATWYDDNSSVPRHHEW